MKSNRLIVFMACVVALSIGCQSPSAEQSWSKATEDMLVCSQLQRLLRCPLLAGQGGALKVMAIGEIKNDTTLVSNNNIEFMKAMIASKLTECGLVIISTVENGRASLSQGGQAIAPTLKLHGKLTQRDFRKEDGRMQREFTLELSIVDLASGIQMWTSKCTAGIVDGGKI